MNKLFLLLLIPILAFGQATTGYHRVNQLLARGTSGVTAQIVPNGSIYVTNTVTGATATIYSDPGLSIQITSGLVTSDKNGNYDYYIPLNYCVNEAVSSPGQGSYTTQNICLNGGGGSGTVGSGTAGQVPYYAANGTTVQPTSSLPNGITATTQTTGDSTTKVATDAFVLANSSGNFATPPVLGGTTPNVVNGTNGNFSGDLVVGAGTHSITLDGSTGTVAASTAVAPFIQSVSCTNGNDSMDYTAVQAAINYIAVNAPGGVGTLRIPEGTVCNILPPSSTSTEALLITTPVSLGGHGELNFQLPAPRSATVTNCSAISSGVITVTGTNSFVAGWTGQFGSTFASNCLLLNNTSFTVLSAGLSGSQFEIEAQFAPYSFAGGADTGTASAGMAAIHFQPASGANWKGVKWENGTIMPVSAPNTQSDVGGSLINLDCSSGGQISNIIFDNLTLWPVGVGYSIYQDNSHPVNANGCTPGIIISNSQIDSGVYLYKNADTSTVKDNFISNSFGDGINIDSISGAVAQKIDHNNVIAVGTPIHLRGGSRMTVTANEVGLNHEVTPLGPASIWLDATDISNPLNDVTLANNIGCVDESGATGGGFALPCIQMDAGVYNVTLGPNRWIPQVVSGVPTAAILNNAFLVRLDGPQTAFGGRSSLQSNGTLWGGTGSYSDQTPLSQAGGGQEYANYLKYSEDFSQSVWATTVTGSGSSASCASPTSVTLPDGSAGAASICTLTLGANSSGYLAKFAQAATTLPNSATGVASVWLKPAICPSSTVYELSNSTGAFQVGCITATRMNNYGWTKNSAPEASAVIELAGGSIYSTTAAFYATWAQVSPNDTKYVKTAASIVTQQNGTDPARFIGPYTIPLTTMGTGTPGASNYVDGGTGAWTNLPTVVQNISVSPASDIVCAHGSDLNIVPLAISNITYSAGPTFTFTVATGVKAYGYLFGQTIQVYGTTGGTGNFNVADYVITAVTSDTAFTATSATATGTIYGSGGSVAMVCNNSVDAIAASPWYFNSSLSIPGLTAGAQYNVLAKYAYFTPTTAPTLRMPYLTWNGNVVAYQGSAINLLASAVGLQGDEMWTISSPRSGVLYSSMDVINVGTGATQGGGQILSAILYTSTNSTNTLALGTSSAKGVYFSSTGLGGTLALTYSSGGTSCTNGTQIVNGFNGAGTGGAGTITVSGNIPTGSVTWTNTGYGYTSIPTTGQVATCTGLTTFTNAGLLGGAQGSGIRLIYLSAKQQ